MRPLAESVLANTLRATVMGAIVSLAGCVTSDIDTLVEQQVQDERNEGEQLQHAWEIGDENDRRYLRSLISQYNKRISDLNTLREEDGREPLPLVDTGEAE